MSLHATRAALLASAALISTPAFAQSNAEAIADEILALGASQGMTINVGSRDMSGSTLRLNDVTYSFAANGSSAEMEVDWLQFKEVGETVEMTFAPSITGEVLPKDSPGKMEMTITNDDLIYTLSGTPDARSYDITGNQMSVTLKMKDDPPSLKIWM